MPLGGNLAGPVFINSGAWGDCVQMWGEERLSRDMDRWHSPEDVVQPGDDEHHDHTEDECIWRLQPLTGSMYLVNETMPRPAIWAHYRTRDMDEAPYSHGRRWTVIGGTPPLPGAWPRPRPQ
jgi:hypothetical protein